MSNEVDSFCTALMQAVAAVKKASEMPGYMTAKAREINASHILKLLKEQINEAENLKAFNEAPMQSKVYSEEGLEKKAQVLKYINDLKPLIDRIKSGNFKLMLDRFYAAHVLAEELSLLLEEIRDLEFSQ